MECDEIVVKAFNSCVDEMSSGLLQGGSSSAIEDLQLQTERLSSVNLNGDPDLISQAISNELLKVEQSHTLPNTTSLSMASQSELHFKATGLQGTGSKIQDVPADQLLQKKRPKWYTLRFMYEQFKYLLKGWQKCELLLSDEKLMSRFCEVILPRLKPYVRMMKSMTDEELDSTDPNLTEDRMMWIAQGSSTEFTDVVEMLRMYKVFANCWNIREIMENESKHSNAQHADYRRLRVENWVRSLKC